MGSVHGVACLRGYAIVVVEVLLQALSALRAVLQRPPEQPVNLGFNVDSHLGFDVDSGRERRGERHKMIEDARKVMGIDCVNHYNFAVCGASGTGKSSFINAIRLIPDNHPDAAKVGVVEATQQVKRYNHPDLKHAFVWDLPGAGTQQHPTNTYFMDMKLYAFDCIFIFSCDRFLEVDMQVAKSALDFQKPISFVRTKADVGIRNLSQSGGLTAEEASKLFRREVSRSFQENLERAGLTNQAHKIPLFIISNKLFTRPKTYFIYDPENETVDNSLKNMDEDEIYKFIQASVETRFRP